MGIGLLGVLTGLVAVRVDQEQGWPIGSATTIRHLADAKAAMSADEKAEWRANLTRDQVPIFVAKVASAGMIILGFGLFFVFQFPG